MNVAIITAGGSGRRLNSSTKKQFLQIAGRPILFWTIDKFATHPAIDRIIITLPPSELQTYSKDIPQEFPGVNFQFIRGGEERQDSVLNALNNCPSKTEYVLIHDGVRPFISQELISGLLDKVKDHKAVIPVTSLKNTVKKISESTIRKTIPRDELVHVLTPQVFSYKLIHEYSQKAKEQGIKVTDDASILEYYGIKIYFVRSDSMNFKITDKADLAIAKLLIENNIGVDK